MFSRAVIRRLVAERMTAREITAEPCNLAPDAVRVQLAFRRREPSPARTVSGAAREPPAAASASPAPFSGLPAPGRTIRAGPKDSAMPQQTFLTRCLALARLDFPARRRQPGPLRLAAATLAALAGSLAADAALAAIGAAVFPATRGYAHFQFADYAKLTIIGVLIACAGWPVVTRISSAPRWLFCRLAVLVTLVLYLPDAYLLVLGQPARAVAVLMLMHLAIAVITYQALIRLAPPPAPLPASPLVPPLASAADPATTAAPASRAGGRS
jgi:hypothetical protein